MGSNENESGSKKQFHFQKANDGKQVLRKMMKNYIPTEITEAQKQGFSSPDASWFKGESIEFIKRKLLNGNSAIYQVLDRKAVVPLVMQHLNGKQNRRLLIWSLLNLDEWIKLNL